MKHKNFFTAAILFFAMVVAVECAKADQRETLSLDQVWRFHLGDVPFPVLKTHDESYANAKAGKAWGAAAVDYDDTSWRELDLPHDWAIEGPFDRNENVSQGYRPRGIGWYRRQFKLDPADRGKHLEIQFDGVATHCTVWFNGMVVARNWCGYTSFYIDITPMAQYGDNSNTLVVRADANDMEGWWYEGAGIYRHTWLVKRNPVLCNQIRVENAFLAIVVFGAIISDIRRFFHSRPVIALSQPCVEKKVGQAVFPVS